MRRMMEAVIGRRVLAFPEAFHALVPTENTFRCGKKRDGFEQVGSFISLE